MSGKSSVPPTVGNLGGPSHLKIRHTEHFRSTTVVVYELQLFSAQNDSRLPFYIKGIVHQKKKKKKKKSTSLSHRRICLSFSFLILSLEISEIQFFSFLNFSFLLSIWDVINDHVSYLVENAGCCGSTIQLTHTHAHTHTHAGMQAHTQARTHTHTPDCGSSHQRKGLLNIKTMITKSVL